MFVAKLVLIVLVLMITATCTWAQLPEVLWDTVYVSHKIFVGWGICSSPDSSYFIVGSSFKDDLDTNNSIQIGLMKMTASGEVIWEKIYTAFNNRDACIGKDVIISSDNSLIILANNSTGNIIIKTDLNGKVIWQKEYNTLPVEEPCFKIIENSSRELFMCGASRYRDEECDASVKWYQYLAKVDNKGKLLWFKELFKDQDVDGKSQGTAFSMLNADDNTLLVTGTSRFGPKDSASVCRIDTDGNILWEKIYGCGQNFTIAKTFDNNYVFGLTDYQIGTTRLIKINIDGSIIWDKYYGGRQGLFSLQFHNLEELPSHDIIGLGALNNLISKKLELRLIFFNSSGEIKWSDYVVCPDINLPYTLTISSFDSEIKSDFWKTSFISLANEKNSIFDKQVHLTKYVVDNRTLPIKESNDKNLYIIPNPFNQSVKFRFTKPANQEILILISDLQGKIVRSITILKNITEFQWNGTNENGQVLPSGVYFLTYNNCEVRKSIKVLKVQ